jgi:SAM-dependent methyltransferase
MEETGRKSFDGVTAVEIGTGWTPGVTLLLHAFGVGGTHTYDKNRLGDADLTRRMLAALPALLERDFPDRVEARDRLEAAARGVENLPFDRILERFGVTYHAPADASRTGLADGSVDFVYSHSVLQYVEPERLRAIFAECRRVLRPNGFMWHLIDFTDGFSHTDRTITSNHFLVYEDWQWNLIAGNRYSYHNRLRPSWFLASLHELGFEERLLRASIDERALAFARSRRLASRFRGCDDGDVAAVGGDIVATVRS